MNEKLSRGPEVDMEKCSRIAGGRFALIRLAVDTAKQIERDHNRSGVIAHANAPVTALLRIQEENTDPDSLRKPK